MEILIRSMTYESDAIARHLGIVDQLPCIIILDDPSSSEYYVLPLDQASQESLRDVRSLIGAFVKRSGGSDFIKAVEEWHRLRQHQRDLKWKAHKLRENYASDLGGNPRKLAKEIRGLRPLLLDGKAKDFRRQLNLLASDTSANSRIPWREVRLKTNKIAAASALIKKLQAAGDGGSGPSPGETNRILQRVARLVHDKDDAPTCDDVEAAVLELESMVQRRAHEVLAAVMGALGIKSDDFDTQYPWESFEKEVAAVQEELDRKLIALKALSRPSLAPCISALKRKKQLSTIVHKGHHIASEVLNKGSTILSMIAKGFDME